MSDNLFRRDKEINTVRVPLKAAACILFYPISKDHLCTVTFGLMYGLYSRAAYDGACMVTW